MHFTGIPKIIQWVLAIGLFSLGWMTFSLIDSVYHLVFLFILIPWLHICVTPLFHLLGIYKYLYPPIFVFTPSHKRYDLHNGNLMDYLLLFYKEKRGEITQKYILKNYAKSCLQIIKEIKSGNLSSTVEIIGYSYFFNERTANKLGFKIGKTDFVTKMCFYLNLVEIVLLYSLVKGTWGIPKFWEAKSLHTTGKILCEKQEFIENLLKKLN